MILQHELRHPRRRSDGGGDANDDDVENDAIDGASVASTEEIKPAQIDKLMAKEIQSLTIQDRNAIYEEIHGVGTMAIEETPELLENALQDFQIELDKMDRKARHAYDLIAYQETETASVSKCIVQSREFRLRFLRCVSFDPAKAAERMVRLFDLLHRVYGAQALKKFDCTMDFFFGTNAEQTAFRAGYLQLLPFRDRSGRKVMVMVTDSLSLDHVPRLKIFMYLSFVASIDSETQRNGLVVLFWPGCNQFQFPSMSYRKLVGEFIQYSPVRYVSFHFCLPADPFFMMFRSTITAILQTARRITRVKFHTGERTELEYQLMGFGIPVSLIPTTGTGTLKTKVFLQWLKARKIIESSNRKGTIDASLKIDCPGVHDVIFRSVGKSCMLNPGNVAFRSIFEKYHSEHIRAGQTEKKNLVWKIVEEVESQGGRFLVWEKRGWWVPLEDRNEIRNKVATSLRGYNKQRRADDNRQYFTSSTQLFRGQDGSGKRMKISPHHSWGESSDDDSGACQKFMGCTL